MNNREYLETSLMLINKRIKECEDKIAMWKTVLEELKVKY